MRVPKVLMIGWEYPPHNSGGLGVACDGLTRALAEANTQIYFTLPYQVTGGMSHLKVLPCYDDDWTAKDVSSSGAYSVYGSTVSSNLNINLSPEEELIDSSELRALPQSELDSRVSQYAEMVAERSRIIHKSIDLIHAHDWMSFPAAEKVAIESKKPFIAHVHSTEYDRVPHGYGSSFIQAVEERGLKVAHHIVAVSQYTKALLIKHYGVPARKISVIHNGIDPIKQPDHIASQSFASKRPVIAFMGRLTMQKGGDYFIDLANIVVKRIPNALFVVAGDGDMYHQLLFHSAYNQLSAHVLFSGFIRDRQRDLLLNRADVFVMPSMSEPFGLVALEAAQRSTPVIVSRQSGVTEVLPGAIRLDFWDVEKMADEITTLVQDPSYAYSVIVRQLENLQSVTWQSSAQKVLTLYEKVFKRSLR